MKVLENQSTKAKLGLFLVTIVWGSAFAATKDATSDMPPSYIILFRFGIAALLMVLLFSRKLKSITRTELTGGLLIGIVNVLGYEFQTYGVQYTTAGNNAFLTAVYCVIVPFLYWIFWHKRPTVFNILSAFLCMAGIGLLSLHNGFSMNKGDILSLMCSVCFALQIIVIDRYADRCDPFRLAFTQIAATALLVLPAALSTEKLPTAVSTRTILALIYTAVFCTLLAVLLQTACQRHVAPSKASLILSLESVFGALSGIIFLGEPVTERTFFGCLLIFGSIFLAEHTSETARPKKPAKDLNCRNQNDPID